MTKVSSNKADNARTVNAILAQMRAVNAKLDADCTSTLDTSELIPADHALRPVYRLSHSLMSRTLLKLDEAMVYLRDTRICDLLLSLLSRLPWAQMRQDRTAAFDGLALLPGLLGALGTFLHATARVRSSQQASAHAEVSKRCQPQERLCTPGDAGNIPNQGI